MIQEIMNTNVLVILVGRPNHKIPDSDYSAYTQVTGGGSPHENRPPYYVLAYVMKIR
jgi:microcystin-dependent protein